MALLTGCGSPPNSQQGENVDTLSQLYANTAASDSGKFYLDPAILPDAKAVSDSILRSGAEYDETLVNPRDRVEDYLLNRDKEALNLGVYLADALYLNGYDKSSDYINYSLVCRRLSEELGINQELGDEISRRLEINLGNRDSIFAILNEYGGAMQTAMREDDQEMTASLVTAGSLAESLHILVSIPADLPPGDPARRAKALEPIFRLVRLQQPAVQKTAECLASYRDEALIPLVQDLERLSATLKAIPANAAKENDFKAATSLIRKIREDVTR